MITGVRAIDFLSFKTLDVSFNKGVTLVDGWNEDDQTPEGSGKSAILNAVCWGLFGKIPKDANIDDVIKHGEKSCAVDVLFSNAVVRRTRGPNELVLIIDGKAIKGKDAKETQLLIEDFLGLTFETFCQTIYFAQNYTKKFITSNQEDKGKILSEVQNLAVFDKAGKEVRSLIKLAEDSLVKLKHSKEVAQKDEELTKRDIQAEDMRKDLALQQQAQRIQSLTSQIECQETIHRNAEAQQAQKIEGLTVQVTDAEKAITDYEALKVQHLESASTLVYDEAKEKALQEVNNQLMVEVGSAQAELSGISRLLIKQNSAQQQGQRYAARYKQIEADKEKNLAFIANPTKDCPTCGSTLEGCDTAHAQAEVDKIDLEMTDIMKVLGELAAEVDAPIPTKDELNLKLGEINQRRTMNDAEIKSIRATKDKLNAIAAHLNGLDMNIRTQRDRIAKLQASIQIQSQPLVLDVTQLETLKVQLDAESQPLVLDTTQLDSLKIKLGSIQSNIEDLTSLISEKNLHVTRLESLKNGFKEIKSHVFSSLLNELNARVQKYLTHLFEVPVSVRFANEDMKIETKVKFDGIDRGLGLLSGGQFRRVSLAVDLALSDVITSRKGSKVDLLILDEYFKDLSENSMEKCLALLENRGQPVLLVEHNSIFKNIVNNSVFVKLENGTSRVEANPN